MTRDEVLPRIREHLADELDLDPEAIVEDARFKEDLEADSLDLYTLVQELEDTYGVTMSDEQAAQILTVGQAVDFVLAHASDRHLSPEAPQRSPRRAAGGPLPAGLHARLVERAARRTPTRAWPSSATACSGWR